MPCAHQNLSACVLINELQTVAERKKKTKPKFQLRCFLWKARVKMKNLSRGFLKIVQFHIFDQNKEILRLVVIKDYESAFDAV